MSVSVKWPLIAPSSCGFGCQILRNQLRNSYLAISNVQKKEFNHIVVNHKLKNEEEQRKSKYVLAESAWYKTS